MEKENRGDGVRIRIDSGEKALDIYDKLNFSPVFEFAPTDAPMANPALTGTVA